MLFTQMQIAARKIVRESQLPRLLPTTDIIWQLGIILNSFYENKQMRNID